jgi:hypothetical protein
MTIRRNVNIAAINDDFMAFERGLSAAPAGFDLNKAEDIRDRVLGYSADTFLAVAKRNGLKTCNCDGIREIEALMFDMIRRQNPDCGIESLIAIGRAEEEAYP